jgi:hypothetical protein
MNWGTLLLYGFLVSLSVSNSYNIYAFIIFLFLLDIPLVYGILGVLMKFDVTRPLIYSILGEKNVNFFLGNPGKIAVNLATRVGIVFVGGFSTTIGASYVQDLANASAAKSYVDICNSSNIPINPKQFESFFNRKNPLDLTNFSWILGKGGR